MSLIKKFKELPEDVKAPIDVVAGCEAAGGAIISLAALSAMNDAIGGFACGVAFIALSYITARTIGKASKYVKNILDEQAVEHEAEMAN